jgi:hypothetical protein
MQHVMQFQVRALIVLQFEQICELLDHKPIRQLRDNTIEDDLLWCSR